MRISDWSSDVCSSDLYLAREQREIASRGAVRLALDDARRVERTAHHGIGIAALFARDGDGVGGGGGDAQFEQRGFARHHGAQEIGRASCRERVCQYV